MKHSSLHLLLFVALILGAFLIWDQAHPNLIPSLYSNLASTFSSRNPQPTPEPSPTPTPSPSPSPSPKPLTLAEMNALYGPCTTFPTLMYHHVQDAETASQNGNGFLTVNPDTFRSQLQYLKDHGYQPTTPQTVINFFDSGATPPSKSVLITFDDGYSDFYTSAFPILREFGFPATLFLSTGLAENPGYLTWSQVQELAGSGLIYVANHTWSHKNVATNSDIVEKEIGTAQSQLESRSLNSSKIFAYPYGLGNGTAQNYLSQNSYTLAFTTIPGKILCKTQRLNLPRVRIGNSSLSSYGL